MINLLNVVLVLMLTNSVFALDGPVLKEDSPVLVSQTELSTLNSNYAKLNSLVEKLLEENRKLREENSRLITTVTKYAEERPGLVEDKGPRYTVVTDPYTGWPRHTRNVWQRSNVGGVAIYELLVKDGKPVPTASITINGHQGGLQAQQNQSQQNSNTQESP